MRRVNENGSLQPRVGGWIVAGSLIALLAGCANPPLNQNVPPAVRAMYSAVDEKPYHIPTVNLAKIDLRYYRQEVPTPPTIREPPGTIVVDPQNRFLYLVEDAGQSMRYGIGVGREGFAWSGTAVVHDKAAWPKWFPPPEMVARDPKVAPYANGMDGGIKNPIGARALYLWQGKKDTLFRLHGTNEPSSIGHAVSSGCILALEPGRYRPLRPRAARHQGRGPAHARRERADDRFPGQPAADEPALRCAVRAGSEGTKVIVLSAGQTVS